MRGLSLDRRYWIAFAICALAATSPLIVTPLLPMADLPEHMAQVAIWKHLDDSCHEFRKVYELNPVTPYLLGYGVSRALATTVTVTTAVKVTVWLAIVLLPLAMRVLFARTGADPWWSLLGFPLAFGYSFYWGFLNFILALPIGIVLLALLYDRRSGTVARSLLALLLLLSHALMFVFVAGVAALWAVRRRSWPVFIPFLIPGCLFGLYVVRLLGREEAAHGGFSWNPGWSRMTDLPSVLFANAWEPWGLVLAGAMTASVALARPHVTREPDRWLLAGAAAAVYFAAPFGAFGIAYLPSRFAVLVAVGAMVVLERKVRLDGTDEPPRTRALVFSRFAIVAIVLVWMAVLSGRFRNFSEEAGEFETVVASLPANRRVALLNGMPFSAHVPGPVFWHFGALYQVRKGGLSAWSFAAAYPEIVRFLPGSEPRLSSPSTPVAGIDWPGILQYDYLLIRGPDARRWLFRDAPVPIRLHAQHGSWWVFATPRAAGVQRDCRPLSE